MNTTKKIVPSYPAPSFEELQRVLDALRGTADEMQVDLVDGKFVPFRSWPFAEMGEEGDVHAALASLEPYTSDYAIEVDCMVEEPFGLLDTFVTLGVGRVVVHMRSTERYTECIAHARKHGYRIGFALTNDVPLAEIEPFIADLDFVQVMGIAEVGKQGQPFDERTPGRVQEIRAKYPDLEIAVDGAVNSETIPVLSEAGVNRFAPGSAITKAADPKEAYRSLMQLIA